MSTIEQPRRPGQLDLTAKISVPMWIAIALMAPMFVSGAVFNTFDIALQSLPLEILRQLNAPFLLAEMAVVVAAARRGFTVRGMMARIDRVSLIAVGVFLASFWIGGVFVSQAAPFATIFNASYLLHALFAGAVMHLAVREVTPMATAHFAMIVAAALALFALAIALQFSNPPAGRDVTEIRWQFALPGFISLRLFGAMVAPFLALIAYLALDRGDDPMHRRWIFPALALSFGLLVWSGTRAGIVGAGVAGLVAWQYFALRLRGATLVPFVAALAVGAVAAVSLIPYGDTDFMLFVPQDVVTADAATGGRGSYWNAVWQAYATVPLVGAGPGATAWLIPPASGISHIQPHNLVIQFLISWGLIAACAALYLLARITIAMHRHARRHPSAIPFVLMADCLLAIGFFDGTFHFAQHLMMWCAAVGLAFAASTRGPAATP